MNTTFNTYLNLTNSMIRYFEETTVHGFRYVVDVQNVIERILWICVILLSFGYASYLIHCTIVDFNEQPVATSFSKVPIREVGSLCVGIH